MITRFIVSCGVLALLLSVYLITWNPKTNFIRYNIKNDTAANSNLSRIASTQSSNISSQLFQLKNVDCKTYGFESLTANITTTSLAIYDFFIFNGEFDLLEIRLYELHNYITLFFIVESNQTFSGKKKPFYLKENWSKVAKYHQKIRRIEVNFNYNPKSPFNNEEQMRTEGLYRSLQDATGSFLLLTSDLDEIPKASFLQSLFECQLSKPFRSLGVGCDFYYYSYEFRHKKAKWIGSTVTFLNLSTTFNRSFLPSGIGLRRERSRYQHIKSGCYHCSWCFDRIEMVRTKMASYSHVEHNTEKFRSRDHILDRYRHGKDLFDRPEEHYQYIANNTAIPLLLKVQPERFVYMTKRFNLSNAGFLDV